MFFIAFLLQVAFLIYKGLILVNLLGSWFPQIISESLIGFAQKWTEPYLSVIRRFVPPVDETLDLSPILGFLLLPIVATLLFHIIL